MDLTGTNLLVAMILIILFYPAISLGKLILFTISFIYRKIKQLVQWLVSLICGGKTKEETEDSDIKSPFPRISSKKDTK